MTYFSNSSVPDHRASYKRFSLIIAAAVADTCKTANRISAPTTVSSDTLVVATLQSVVGDIKLYERISEVLYIYALPIISTFGFFGNLMNLLILTGRRIQHSLKSTEKAANTGLIALAVSDLAFCITAFPSTFLPADLSFTGEPGFLALYACYCSAIISIFIMTSTWLTVAMSAERYLAICHPLGSRRIISLNRTRLTIVIINVMSIAFNLPLLWRYLIITKEPNLITENSNQFKLVDHHSWQMQSINGVDNDYNTNQSTTNESPASTAGCNVTHSMSSSYLNMSPLIDFSRSDLESLKRTYVRPSLQASDSFEHAYRLAWAITGNFIPLLILIFCNLALMKEIHKSYALRRHMKRSVKRRISPGDLESSQRITITLVCIVVMFLVLVAPSEIVKHLAALSGTDLDTNYYFKTIEVVTNLMQAVNFSANFILYCIVNPSFRRTMQEMVRSRLGLSTHSYNNSRPPSVSSARAAKAPVSTSAINIIGITTYSKHQHIHFYNGHNDITSPSNYNNRELKTGVGSSLLSGDFGATISASGRVAPVAKMLDSNYS